MLNRRHFMGTAAMLLLAGCGPGDWLLNEAQSAATGSDPQPGNDIDLARHVLNRCPAG
jgi:hypothetical protein